MSLIMGAFCDSWLFESEKHNVNMGYIRQCPYNLWNRYSSYIVYFTQVYETNRIL